MRTMTHWALAAMAAAALALAGCGGGGSGNVSGPIPEPPAPSTPAQQALALAALVEANDAADAAVMAANDAVKEAEDAVKEAEDAVDAADKALAKAMAGRKDVAAARTAKENADTALTDAKKAKEDADEALMDAKKAQTTVAGIDSTMVDTAEGAEAIKTAAEAAETAATAAETAAMAAETAAMAAETAATTAETAAEMAAGVHVLALFKDANAYDVTAVAVLDDPATTDKDESMTAKEATAKAMADEVASVGMAIMAAADDQMNKTATASWMGNMADDPGTAETDESTMEVLTVTVDGITSDTKGNDNGTPDDATDDVKPNAMMIDPLGVFAGFDLADAKTNKRFIVFTDKMQGTHQVLRVDAQTEIIATDVPVGPDKVEKLGEMSGGMYVNVTVTANGVENNATGDPLTGTLSCPANVECVIEIGTDGLPDALTGYVFNGSRPAVEAVDRVDAADDDMDYLIFGLWLDEASGGADSFGAFSQGGDAAASLDNAAIKGTAMYAGSAAGAHHITDGPVSWFDGDAMLTADFDTDMIEGEISNIRVDGGAPLADSIHLSRTGFGNDGTISGGTAEMGVSQPFLGTWQGKLYGQPDDDKKTDDVSENLVAPGSVAGTFGVSRDTDTGDDVVTESFVGAFGAHKQ